MFLVTEEKNGFAIFNATDKQTKSFMTDPKQAVRGKCWAINNVSDIAEEMTIKDQVGLFNQYNENKLVKFPTKAAGAQRVFPLLEEHAELFQPAVPKKNVKAKQVVGVINLPADECVYSCRQGSKQACLVDALHKGATMQQLVEACSSKYGGRDWSAPSVKSGMYWDINKLKGYGIRTELNEKGVHSYFLTFPDGMSAPLPHTPLRKPATTT